MLTGLDGFPVAGPPVRKKDERFLKPLRSKIKRKACWVFDFETKDDDSQDKGWTRPFCCGFYDGDQFTLFRNDESVMAFPWRLRHLCPGGLVDKLMRYVIGEGDRFQSKHGAIYAHNGGKFDDMFVIGWLLMHQDEFVFEIASVQSRIQRLDFWPKGQSKKLGHWSIFDSIGLLPMSLKKVGETFSPGDVEKMDMDLDLPEQTTGLTVSLGSYFLGSTRREADETLSAQGLTVIGLIPVGQAKMVDLDSSDVGDREAKIEDGDVILVEGAQLDVAVRLAWSDTPTFDVWETYNALDCKVLYVGLSKFHDLVEEKLGGEVGITAPATSMKLFRRRYQNEYIHRNAHFKECNDACKHGYRTIATKGRKKGVSFAACGRAGCDGYCHGCAHDWVRRGYYGGRTEMFAEEGFDIRYFDINSSYPASMLADMPVGRMVVPKSNRMEVLEELARTHVGFVECEVYIPKDCALPPLPYRVPDGKRIVVRRTSKRSHDYVEVEALTHFWKEGEKGEADVDDITRGVDHPRYTFRIGDRDVATFPTLGGVIELTVWKDDRGVVQYGTTSDAEYVVPPGKLIFPTGTLYGVWDWEELRLLQHPIVGGKITRVVKSVWYERSPVFREMVHDLYVYRQKHNPRGVPGGHSECPKVGTAINKKGKEVDVYACGTECCNPKYSEGLSFCAKLMLNSLYGKFGMREERTGLILVPEGSVFDHEDGVRRPFPPNAWPIDGEHETCRVWEAERLAHASYIVPQISAHITSLSRIRLFEGMADVLIHGVCRTCDTRHYLGPPALLGRGRKTCDTCGNTIERGKLLYGDTDSIMATINLSAHLLDDGILGKWKREKAKLLLSGRFRLPKLYQLAAHEQNCRRHEPRCINTLCIGCCRGCRLAFHRPRCKDKKCGGCSMTEQRMKGVGGDAQTTEGFEAMITGKVVRSERVNQHKSMLKRAMAGEEEGFSVTALKRGKNAPDRVYHDRGDDHPEDGRAKKSMRSGYDKRILLPNGDTVPIHVH